MLFNSLTFFVFLAIVLALYYVCSHRWQNVLLLVASYVFYGWWDYRFLSLLFFSTVVDYCCALRIERSERLGLKRLYLAVSLATNLGVLGFFKYYNFFAQSTTGLFANLGLQADALTLEIILPVGISFYTFQSLSYTIDVYRGTCEARRSLLDVALYVAFFPQLVAGPIERATHLLPEIEQPRHPQQAQLIDGIWLMLLGYVKKVVIADRCAALVNASFVGSSLPEPGLEGWLCLYAFAFQIYGDFSGYSDIARGVSKLLGFELMVNFRAPYLVTNPSAFWQNWHISLSTWLRDYLYIPLGGNRGGSVATYRNLMLTMLLGGLWHGAGWAFLIWGLYQGLLLVGHRALQPVLAMAGHFTGRLGPVFKGGAHAVTVFAFFQLTCIGWLIFRADSLPDDCGRTSFIFNSLALLADWPALDPLCFHTARVVLPLGMLALLFQWRCDDLEQFHDWPTSLQVLTVTAALTLITSLGVFDGADFIYFQF